MDLNDESPFLATLRAVKGNVPQHVKDNVIELYRGATQGQRFLMSITRRLKAIESNIYSRPEEPSKKEVKMVFEIDVTEDMCHFGNSVHGGCVASLVDFCSSVTLSILAAQTAPIHTMQLSLMLTTTYHAPAPFGCRLKIVSSTVALGGRVGTARVEIYDKTNSRIVASGSHVKMPPAPRL